MKINQLKLKHATEIIKRLIPNVAIIPYHGYILLKTTNKGLTITYTNNEATIRILMVDGFAGDIDMCVDGMILKALTEADVELDFAEKDNRCVVKYRGGSFKLAILDPENYPIPEHKRTLVGSVDAVELHSAIKNSNGFGDTYLGHYLYGMRFVSDGDFLEVGSSNLFAGSYTRLNLHKEKDFAFTVPTDMANTIRDLAADCSAVDIYDSGQDIVFSLGHTILFVRKSATAVAVTTFSEWVNNASKELTDKVIISDRKYLIDQVKRAGLFSDATQVLTIKLAENLISLSGTEDDKGRTSNQDIECVFNKRGDSTMVLVKHSLLVKVLAKMTSTDVIINLAEDGDPVANVICIEENDTSYFLMPFFQQA